MRAATILFAALCALAPHAAAQTAEETRALERALPAGTSITKELLVFTPAERERIARAAGLAEGPRTLRVFAARDGHDLAGMAVLADAPGKCQPITYLLATDAAARIRSVEVLVYREAHGGEVRDERWRRQFVGKDPSSPLRLANDVRNVAGATISCRSLTDAVRRDVQALEVARVELARRAAGGPFGEIAAPGPAATAGGGTGPRARLLMGTTLVIDARGVEPEVAERACTAAFDCVAALERALSDWDASSELSRLSDSAGGASIEVSEPLASVLARAQFWQRESGGAFDPCLGALTRLLRAGTLPRDALELRPLLAGTGPGALEVDGRRARLARTGARLDLGAIGKGFALDRAAAELERNGVHAALLDFGGQLLALDPPPGESGWVVALRDPAHPGASCATRRIRRQSVACTADYERGRIEDGRRVSHVLDPRSGRPVEGMLGVIVLNASATDADALSTALYVLGADAGEHLAREHGVEAWLWPVDGAPRCTFDAVKDTAPAAERRLP